MQPSGLVLSVLVIGCAVKYSAAGVTGKAPVARRLVALLDDFKRQTSKTCKEQQAHIRGTTGAACEYLHPPFGPVRLSAEPDQRAQSLLVIIA